MIQKTFCPQVSRSEASFLDKSWADLRPPFFLFPLLHLLPPAFSLSASQVASPPCNRQAMAGGAARRRAAKRRAAESLSSQPPDEPPPLLDGPLSIPQPSPPLRCPGLPPPPHYICTFIPVAFTLYNLATAGACFQAFIGLLMGFFVLCSGATSVLYRYNVMFATQGRLMVARMVLLSILMACNLHHGTEVYASQEFLASLHIASCVVVLLLGCPFGTSAMLLFTWASFLVVTLFVFNAKN